MVAFALVLAGLAIAGQQLPLALAASQPPSLKTVDLGYAKYQTDVSLQAGVTSFLGVRFAAPPTGPLRWRAPQLPAKVNGVLNATAMPNQCFQESIEGSMGISVTSPFRTQQLRKRDTDGIHNEDCLFLNVHVPTTPKTKSLVPVVVYMHGGGYDAGNVSLYPVQDFVTQSGFNLVSVSIQYRLGLFGFLSGQKVKDGGVLNAGLLDQNFALQWVQQHIASFGGDPTRVTIWGQSAGAGAMLQHVVAHAGNTQPPLFRAVLMNSPFLPFQYNYNDPIPEKLYSDVVSQVGCARSIDTLACLRTTNASDLLVADTNLGLASFLGTYAFVPVVDGSFIVERPTVTLKRGRVNGKALLVTSAAHEGVLFVNADVITANNFTLKGYITQLFPRMNAQQIQQAVDIYTPLGATVVDQTTLVMGDAILVCPAFNTVGAYGSGGKKARFAIPPGTHALDLSYEFSTFGIPPTFTNPEFITAYQQTFISTIMSLDANIRSVKTIAPTWPSWSQAHQEMLFNKTESDEPVIETFTSDPGALQRCAFWTDLAAVNSQ